MAGSWSEDYRKLNSYTLLVTETSGERGSLLSSITRAFNFAAGTIRTTTRDWIVAEESGGYSSRPGYAANSVMITSETQKMKDQPVPDEVIMMHEKLIKMGGSPPDLRNIIPGNNAIKTGAVIS